MPRPTLSDCVCCPRAVMACHSRCCRPCALYTCSDVMPRTTSFDRACSSRGVMSCHTRHRLTVCAAQRRRAMPRPTSFDHVCWPRAVMSCHARRRLTVNAAQRRWWHATSDVVQPCVLSKGGDVMPRPTSSNCMCCPRAVMACHARCHPTMCAVQGR